MRSPSWVNSHDDLRVIICDPERWKHDDHAAHAAYMLRQRALQQLSEALVDANINALAIKGAGLAATCYQRPWQREMTDIDLLVQQRDLRSAEKALSDAGCHSPTCTERRLTRHDLGAQMFVYQLGRVSIPIDLHAQVDKVVTRPVDYAAVFSRAQHVPSLGQLRVPEPLDHLLLVVLHAAASGFTHQASWIDLEVLLRNKPNVPELIVRAKQWRLTTPTWLMLEALSGLGSRSVPDGLTQALRPPKWRQKAVALFYRIDELTAVSRKRALGWRWAAQQTPLRDDPVRWATGLARYAVRRFRERALDQ